jgi:hypothetical protein
MNRLILRNALRLAGVAILFCGAAAYAQVAVTPYLSNEGLSLAEGVAKDSLNATDAILTSIVSGDPSMLDSSAGSLPFQIDKFDMQTGKASAWVYNFYSPSKMRTAGAIALKIPILGFQAFASTDTIDPDVMPPTTTLDVSGTYATSDKLVEQVKANSGYQTFHTENPDVAPSFIILRAAEPDDVGFLPDNFPLDAPFWTMAFGTPTAPEALVCFVASKTGATFCQAAEIPSGVEETSGAARATMAVTPNPSNGRTRVAVALPSGVRSLNDVAVELYDVTGRKVLDLTESFRANALQFAEFDSSNLPAGLYYCRAAGNGWHGMAGVVVQK